MHFKAKPLPVVFFTIFLDMLGYGVLIPVVPLLLADPSSPFYLLPTNISGEYGYFILSLLVAIFPFAQFLSTPILGQLSDKFGRKKILAFSLLGTCFSYILFAFGILSKSLPLLFLARFFDGLTGGNISVAQAAIADVSTPENRAKNFGLIGGAFGLGFILGPYIGGKLSDPNLMSWFNAATPFWFAAILSFLNIILMLFFFPETLKNKNAELLVKWGESIKNIIKALRIPYLRLLFTTNFLFQSGFTFFTTFFSIFLIARFGFNQGNIGDFFSYVGLWVAFTQVFVTRQMSQSFKENQILKFSVLGAGICISLFFIPHTVLGLLLIAPMFAILNGLSQANIVGLISRSAGANIQGEILGINASVQALAQSIPPILAGLLAAEISAVAPVAIASIIVSISGLIFIIFYKKNS